MEKFSSIVHELCRTPKIIKEDEKMEEKIRKRRKKKREERKRKGDFMSVIM